MKKQDNEPPGFHVRCGCVGPKQGTWNPDGVRMFFVPYPPGGGFAATGGYKQGTPMGFGPGTARPQGKEGQSEASLGRAAVPGRRGARGRAPSLRWRLLTASLLAPPRVSASLTPDSRFLIPVQGGVRVTRRRPNQLEVGGEMTVMGEEPGPRLLVTNPQRRFVE